MPNHNIYRGQNGTYTYKLFTIIHTHTHREYQPQDTYYLNFLEKVMSQISKCTPVAII